MRRDAQNFINKLSPAGTTYTELALDRAMQYPGIDTVVLFTDGQPNYEDGAGKVHELTKREDLDLLVERLHRKYGHVVINTIAIGQGYFKETYGEFLQKLAASHRGAFIGR